MEAAVDGDPEGLRRELRAFLEAHLTDDLRRLAGSATDEADDIVRWQGWNRVLFDGGWAAPAWPAEYGGRNATVAEQLAYLEEMSRQRAPGPVNVIGVSNIAPAIMEVGSPEQCERFLLPMLRGEEIWCQGMSEPDAGSDLASLRTAAVRHGDHFVVNGQKTWNSLGRFAQWCQLYVRTDPDAPRHRGISCLLVDMATPGITVRPLRTMAGELTFCELFFDDVAVPASALLGDEGQGWSVAMTTLGHERAGVARLHLGLAAKFERLVADARGTPGLADPVRRDRLAACYARIACMRWTTTRDLEAVGRGGPPSPTMGSGAKLQWARIDQELGALAVDLLGPAALVEGDGLGRWGTNLWSVRQASIAGGTTEINKSIVAEHGLGLPREPRPGSAATR